MEKIIKQETQYVEQIFDIEMYVTSDGIEFEDEDKALKHENYLSFKKVRFDHYFTIAGEWFYFENEERMKSIIWESTICREERFNNFVYPLWLLVYEETSYGYGDSHVFQCVYQFSEVEEILDRSYLALRLLQNT